MVKFEFELSDVDAENLFGCIDTEIMECKMIVQQSRSKPSNDENSSVNWCKNRVEYLSLLKTKLHNTKV